MKNLGLFFFALTEVFEKIASLEVGNFYVMFLILRMEYKGSL